MISLSKNYRLILRNGLFLLLIMTLMRISFFLFFKDASHESVADAFFLGLRYDLKMLCIPILGIWLLSSLPFLSPFKHPTAAKFWNTLWWIMSFLILCFYTADFGHYAYLQQRLNANILSYAGDAAISSKMLWQSYPVIRWLLIAIAFLWFTRWVIRKNFFIVNQQPIAVRKKGMKIAQPIIFFLLLAVAIFGRVGQYPLRWSDAFDLGSEYKSNLALNPFQSFFSTLQFRRTGYDLNKVKAHYAELAQYYGIENPDPNTLNFERSYQPRKDFVFQQPNIVLVICESFSAYKSSMYGNPLNTTPFFNSICNNGIFFDRCFTPCYGTARGVWATLTGIPDVTIGATTNTRNPAIVSQHTILNDFKGYEKYYFIGGSASWANIRGLLKNNIDSLHLFEQGDYKAPKIDVWGVSDKNVFLEANQNLAKANKPFFAVIQTSDNHRPYTIPDEDKAAFKVLNVPQDTLLKYGFTTLDEFNAFRYTDFCYQKFIEAAQKEAYFNNTIFVFVGDHGIRGNAGDMLPKVWTEEGLTCQHVPLLFYSPKLLQPKRYSYLVSQLDILPTLAGLSGIPYTNMALGTDILNPAMLAKDSGRSKHLLIFDDNKQLAGTGFSPVFYEKNINNKTGDLYSLVDNSKPQNDSMRNALQSFTEGWLEFARYIPYKNKKK